MLMKLSLAAGIANGAAPARRWAALAGRIRRRAIADVTRWFARSRQRRALAKLDARLLADVGITPEAARREIAKPFWR